MAKALKRSLTRQLSLFETVIVIDDKTHTWDTWADFESEVIIYGLPNWEAFFKQLKTEKWPEAAENKKDNAEL